MKVPEYSLVFEEDSEGLSMQAFEQETKEIFMRQPRLLTKLQKLQTVLKKIYEIIDTEGSEVRVSFFVYESISKLAKSDIVSEWRSLEMLRPTRNFNPNSD